MRIALLVVGITLGSVAALAAVRRRVESPKHIQPEDISLLRSNPLFGWLPPVALERIAVTLEHVQLPQGGVLLRQGDEGDRAYIVSGGELLAERDGLEIGRIGPGEVVGEIALLQSAPRMATVRALEPTRLLAIDGDEFLAAVTGGSTARKAAADLVAERLAVAGSLAASRAEPSLEVSGRG